ncbi:MAG: bile acid:sodium symporter family protein [Pyrinomonadaceae bacterium]
MTEQKTNKNFSLTNFKTVLANGGLDGFLLMLGAMIILAYFFPSFGVREKPVSLEEITSYGLTLIFFFYGLRLSFQKLRLGLGNWRMHVVIQLTTFVFFPLVVLSFKPFFGTANTQVLWLGAFFLASLPSTVSSSVVMVSIAGGNLPAAIFNATISSVLGIFITPLWMSLVLSKNTQNFDMRSILLKLMMQVLLPFVVGVALNRFFGNLADAHRKKLRYFDQSVILLIVYTAFCHSFTLGIFKNYSVSDIALLILAMAALFFSSYIFIYIVSRLFKFTLEDTVTVLFCGSKKSLVHGTLMSKVLFQDSSIAGIILLPIMIYHALQLIAASIVARRVARQNGNIMSNK